MIQPVIRNSVPHEDACAGSVGVASPRSSELKEVFRL
jgi:hypothetical protein